jgi:hypothetical protein
MPFTIWPQGTIAVVVVVLADVVVVVDGTPSSSSTHELAVTSMASHGWVCTLQSPWPCALVHEEVNLV